MKTGTFATNDLLLIRQPNVEAPVWVAGGSWSIGGDAFFVQLLVIKTIKAREEMMRLFGFIKSLWLITFYDYFLLQRVACHSKFFIMETLRRKETTFDDQIFMTYKEFIARFNKNVFTLSYDRQMILALAICKKLYFDYVIFTEKYNWGNTDVLMDAIKVLEQLPHKMIDEICIKQIQKNIDHITPDTEDFPCDEIVSYGLNACVAVYTTFSFLLDQNPQHICDVGSCLTDTIDIKIQEEGNISEEEIDNHPMMIEAREYLLRLSE